MLVFKGLSILVADKKTHVLVCTQFFLLGWTLCVITVKLFMGNTRFQRFRKDRESCFAKFAVPVPLPFRSPPKPWNILCGCNTFPSRPQSPNSTLILIYRYEIWTWHNRTSKLFKVLLYRSSSAYDAIINRLHGERLVWLTRRKMKIN